MQTHELPEVGSHRCSHFIFILFDPVQQLQWFYFVCHVLPPRGVQVKTLLGLTANTSPISQSQKARPKHPKPKAEPPPKKRKKWKEEFSPAPSASSAEEGAEDNGEKNFFVIYLCHLSLTFYFLSILICWFLLSLSLRVQPFRAVKSTSSQHTTHEGDVQEFCRAAD